MGWFILLGIVLLIAIALFMSISVSVSIDDETDVKIKYAGITFLSFPKDEDSEKAKKKKAKKEAKAKKKAEKKKLEEQRKRQKAKQKQKPTEPPENVAQPDKEELPQSEENVNKDAKDKKTPEQKKREKLAKKKKLQETFDLIKLLVKSAGKPAKRLISHIRVTNLNIDITASGEDAAKAALNYGKINIAVGSLLGFLNQFVRLHIKKVNIGVDFESGETKFALYCKIKMRISTALGCGIWFLFRMIKYNLQKNDQNITTNQNTTDGKPSVNKKGK